MGRTVPLNEELAQAARKLYVPYVFSYKAVAQRLGISVTSVRRYVDAEYRERDLRRVREAKRRRTGICKRCGGETRYNGRTINGPSVICKACSQKPWTHCAKGHELTPENRLSAGQSSTCRICRNQYARERSYRKRREAGVPERGPYMTRRLKLESEGPAQT